MHFDAFLSTTLAILLLLTGKGVIARVAILRRYSIPEALVGGVLCAAVACVLFYAADIELGFELAARDTLLLYFFASVGLSTDIRTLSRGGAATAHPERAVDRLHRPAELHRHGAGGNVRHGCARGIDDRIGGPDRWRGHHHRLDALLRRHSGHCRCTGTRSVGQHDRPDRGLRHRRTHRQPADQASR